MAGAVVPFVTAAVGAYGAGVISRIQDGAADATVNMGGELLRRLLRRPESAPELQQAVTDLAVDPADEGRLAILQLRVLEILHADRQIRSEVVEILQASKPDVSAVGTRSVATGSMSGGIVVTGDNAQITR
ncbi:hypothetical protein [Micromonospora qiuiae]|uniref:hypothetical protein n=1 Tax=Micromonospora qiuiae TaxID=502268 RepID=UPI001EF37BD1|nr:hypothetical protein [Micromonospora qiuiae]